MGARLFLALSLSIAVPAALAVETTQWPPPPEVLGRMRDLQETIKSPATSKEERAAARSELEKLMKSPAGRDRQTAEEKKTPPDTKRPARAAIDPFPSVAKPIEGPLPAPPPTARLEVVPDPPRRATINPSSGSVIPPPTMGPAVDPRTGRLLHEVPGGYVDPRTGQFVPK